MNLPFDTRTRISRGRRAILACLGAAQLAGCQAGLPRYAARDPHESLGVIADRLAGVASIQSEATIAFSGTRSGEVQLDAALVARPPDHLRLRAWKLDRVVFDATLEGGELWLLPSEEGQAREAGLDRDAVAKGIRRAVQLMAPGFYRAAEPDRARTTDRELVVHGWAGDARVTCVIDRATLTPRHFTRAAGDLETDLAISLEDYRMVGSTAWPGTWIIRHPGGRVVIRLRDVVLNGELAPGAFTPPRRAVRSR